MGDALCENKKLDWEWTGTNEFIQYGLQKQWSVYSLKQKQVILFTKHYMYIFSCWIRKLNQAKIWCLCYILYKSELNGFVERVSRTRETKQLINRAFEHMELFKLDVMIEYIKCSMNKQTFALLFYMSTVVINGVIK